MNRRVLTLFTLLLWGSLLLWFSGGGVIVAYLHPDFHPLVTAAGVVLLVLAAAWWWATREIQASCGSCGCQHDHGEAPRSAMSAGAVFAFVVLLLPVSAAALFSPGQFGEAAVMNRGIVRGLEDLPVLLPLGDDYEDSPLLGEGDEIPDAEGLPGEEGVEYFTRSPDGAIELETIDLLFAAGEQALRDEFDNQRVVVTGQFVPPTGSDAGQFDLVRMFMVCCAADARPVGIKVGVPQSPDLPRMGWIRVTGTARFLEVSGVLQPRVEAEKIEEVPAPRETVLY